MLLYKLLTGSLLCISLQSAAQELKKPSPRNTIRNFINPDSLPLMNLKVIPVPILTSSPETGIRAGGALEYFFNAKEKGKSSEARGSYVHGQLTFSSLGQLELKGSWQIFTKGERYVFKGSAGYTTSMDRFWGIGNNTLAEDNYYKQDYSRLYLESKTYRLLKNNWYAGLAIDYNDIYNVKTNKALDPVNLKVPGINGSKFLGLGPAFLYEGRDFPFSAHKGAYAECFFTHYLPVGGDQFRFDTWMMDLRKFYPLNANTTVAFQFLSQNSIGNTPLRAIPKIGGPLMMRGYFTGRYRDQSYTAAQAEIRYHIWRWIYGASFIAGGILDKSLSKYELNNLHYAGGTGLRFLVNKKNRMFLRVDYALNSSSSGNAYYIRLNEAF